MCFSHCYKHIYIYIYYHKIQKRDTVYEYGGWTRNINLLAPIIGREATEMQVPNAFHYWASCLPYKEHLWEYGQLNLHGPLTASLLSDTASKDSICNHSHHESYTEPLWTGIMFSTAHFIGSLINHHVRAFAITLFDFGAKE